MRMLYKKKQFGINYNKKYTQNWENNYLKMIMIYKKKRINIIKIINFNKLKHLKWAEK